MPHRFEALVRTFGTRFATTFATAFGIMCTATFVATVALPTASEAQDSTRAEPTMCWRGRPAPACRTFLLTELGYYRVAAASTFRYRYQYPDVKGDTVTVRYTEESMSAQLTAELGAMQNVGPRTALGGSLVLGVGTGGADVGVKGRYRRWLSPEGAALDLGAGVISGQIEPQSGAARGLGVTADVALNAADYGAVVVRADLVRARGQTASALYGGIRLGSKPAAAGAVLLGAGFVVLAWLFSRSID